MGFRLSGSPPCVYVLIYIMSCSLRQINFLLLLLFGSVGFGSVRFEYLHIFTFGSASVRFLVKPGFWFGSFLLGSSSIPSLLHNCDRRTSWDEFVGGGLV